MASAQSPTVRRRRLALELRRLRESAKLTCEEVAERLECSASKISRVETGRVSVSPRDVRDMLEIYGAPPEQRDSLVQLARDSRQKGWWHAYGDSVQPQFATYLGLESAASDIRIYEVCLIPGLLQTEDYARALIRLGSAASEDEIRRRTELRVSRQEVLRGPNPPQLWAVVDEGALRRPVGGREVVLGQLRHLVQMADHPAVTLQILPFHAGSHAAMGGPFTILRFAEPDLQDVVYIEQLTSALYLDKPSEVDSYLEVMEQLCLQAEPVANTTKVLKQILAET